MKILQRNLYKERKELWKGRPEASLTSALRGGGGRNNNGRITVRHRGGGVKKRYRQVDFLRRKDDVWAEIVRLEYDPNRTAWIALIKYEDDESLSYIIAPEGLKAGDKVISGSSVDKKVGNTMELQNIPQGTFIHNVELEPGKGAKLARSAGTFVKLLGKEADFALIKPKSGEVRKVPLNCRATIGVVSNAQHQHNDFKKAGTRRRLGWRPIVRGVAMNPVDHPHGGRTNRKGPQRSFSGVDAKGGLTRNPNRYSNHLILKRRPKNIRK